MPELLKYVDIKKRRNILTRKHNKCSKNWCKESLFRAVRFIVSFHRMILYISILCFEYLYVLTIHLLIYLCVGEKM